MADIVPQAISRRQVLRLGGWTAAGLALAPWGTALAGHGEHDQHGEHDEHMMGDVHDPDQALQLLLGGNQRWASGQAVHPNQSTDRRVEVAGGQHPLAIVFSCVDSRVPPELVFDQGLGDLLVIRTAAHVLDNAALGSIEFGVEELHIPLVMVLGHERCGAVTASVDAVTQNAQAPGQIAAVVEGLRPAVVQTNAQTGDRVDNAVRAHVTLTVERLRQTGPILTEFQEHGELKIVGGRYDLDTGLVELLA